MTDADADDILCDLIREYGGADRLSVTQIAISKALASELCQPTPSGSIIASLSALMPKPVVAEVDGSKFDPGNLDDDELALAAYLQRKALGQDVEKPKPHKTSRREWLAVEVAQFVDRVLAGNPYHLLPLSAEDKEWTRAHLSTLLHPLGVLDDIFQTEVAEKVRLATEPLQARLYEMQETLAGARVLEGQAADPVKGNAEPPKRLEGPVDHTKGLNYRGSTGPEPWRPSRGAVDPFADGIFTVSNRAR